MARLSFRDEWDRLDAWEKLKLIGYTIVAIFIVGTGLLWVTGQTPEQEAIQNCQEELGNESFFSEGECYNQTDIEVIASDYVYRHRPRVVDMEELGNFMGISSFDIQRLMDNVAEQNCHYTKVDGGWFETHEYTFVEECAGNKTDPIW